MATEALLDISVTDVYDQAAGIAREFDKLINSYGSESVTDLMPKVIRTLEHLESLTTRYEKDSGEIAELKAYVEKLESEKADKAQERAKFEQEVEVIEDNWQSEVKELLTVVGKLQDENKRLKLSLQTEKYAVEEKFSAKFRESEEQEIKVLNKLKETVDKQREELRSMKRDLSQRTVDCEALQAQLEQIAKVNADLRHKNNTHKKQTRTLLDEKAELEVALRHKDVEVEKVKVMITEQEIFQEQRAAVRAAIAEQRESEEHAEDEKAAEDGDVCRSQSVDTGTGASLENADHNDDNESNTSPTSPGLQLEGKMIIDLKDPNRPRFTLEELRQVLMERNELKTRLIEVEEELNLYRPRECVEEGAGDDDDDNDESNQRPSYGGEETLVYGPINREPDEKVFGAKESGIRKLFLSLLEAGLDLLGDESANQRPRSKGRAELLSMKTLKTDRRCQGGGVGSGRGRRRVEKDRETVV